MISELLLSTALVAAPGGIAKPALILPKHELVRPQDKRLLLPLTQAAVFAARWGSASEWPDATNTGVPAGTTLTPVSGFTTTSNGQIIEDLDISGVLTINHDNVIVRRCRITAASYWVIRIMSGAIGCQITYCKLIGGSGSIGAKGVQVDGSGCRIQRVHITNCEDGVYSGSGGSDLEILDNYINALAGGTAPHHDGLQINGSNTTVRGNNVDLDQAGVSSAITHGNCSNIIIDGNRLIGGVYIVRFPGDRTITNVTLTGNRFGFNNDTVGYIINDGVAGTFTVNGNVDDTTSNNIDSILGA